MPEAALTPADDEVDDLMTDEEVSARYRGRITVGALRNWRALRIGPAYVKVGKAVLYKRSALICSRIP